MSAETAEKTDRSTNRRLAFGVFAPPVAWFAHEIIGVSVVGRQCQMGGDLTGWQWGALVVVSLLAAGTAIAAGSAAYGVFKRCAETSVDESEGRSLTEFVALAGVIVSTLLLLNIIYFGVMPFVVEPCARAI